MKPGALTVSVMGVVAVREPEVPVMVTIACPAAALLLAKRVIVLFPVAGLGEKDAVTPLGKPEALKVTPLEKPY